MTSTISHVTLVTRKSGILFLLVNVVTILIEGKFVLISLAQKLIYDKGQESTLVGVLITTGATVPSSVWSP